MPSDEARAKKAAYGKKWNADNKEAVSERNKRNRELNLEHIKEQRKSRKILVIEAYGGKCDCCGENHIEFLCIDHINGGGRAHREEVGRGHSFYLWLIRNGYPDGFRVLCANCNMAYGLLGYCPHQMGGEHGSNDEQRSQ